jgi:carbamate kinase
MRIVVALGGNAIARRGDSLDSDSQRRRVREAVAALAPIAGSHELVITHGNGPQVGLLALQAHAHGDLDGFPLDVLGAESEGMIGYLLASELMSRLPRRQVVTLLTQVEVDADDPGFRAPSKPIGPRFAEATARDLEARLGWHFVREEGGLRRVVPSPQPQRICEVRTIELLVGSGVLVVCAGGGGIPVVRRAGEIAGVEAVIDKDLTAALLARELHADQLVLLTDVAGVYRDWPDRGDLVGEATPAELRALALDPGSMGPKVEAACRFVESGGRAAIGRLDEAYAVLRGRAGTRVAA